MTKNSSVLILLTLLLFQLMVLVPPGASGNTYVSGSVSGVWIPDNGPYIVTDDAWIAQGQVLSVLPGVVVRFHDDKSLYVDGSLSVEGSLSDPVTFTSNSSLPGRASWWVVQFNETANGNLSQIDHAVIEYALFGIRAEGVSVRISNTTFSMNGDGVRLVRSSSSITNSIFTDNFRGVGCYDSSNATIVGSDFRRNIDIAIRVEDSFPLISGNTISENGQGLLLDGRSTANISLISITNSSECGICVYEESFAEIHNVVLSRNRRGLSVVDSSLSARDVEISAGESGVVLVSSHVRMENSTILNNSLEGIYAYASPPDHTRTAVLSLWNSTISASTSNHLRLGNNSVADFYGTDFRRESVVFDSGNSLLTVHWFLGLTVEDYDSNPICDSLLSISDNENGTFSMQVQTDESGMTTLFPLREYQMDNSSLVSYSPYTILAVKENYEDNETIVHLSANALLTIRQKRLDYPPTVSLYFPTGGEELTVGSRVIIRWTAQDDHTAFKDLRFRLNYTCYDCEDGGIGGPLVGVDSYDWLIPDALAECNVSISISVADEAGLISVNESGWIHMGKAKHPSWWEENLWILIVVALVVVLVLALLFYVRRKTRPSDSDMDVYGEKGFREE